MSKARDLDEMPDVFLLCRALGHAMEPEVTFKFQAGRQLVYDVWWACDRERRAGIDPPTRRHALYNAKTGEPFDLPRYEYPDGYQLERVKGRGRGGSYRRDARSLLLGRLTKGQKVRKNDGTKTTSRRRQSADGT